MEDASQRLKRRQILEAFASSLAAGLAGCTINSRNQDNDENDDTDVDTNNNDFRTQRLRPAKKHPRYWEFNGEPRLLLGASDTDSLFQWGKNLDKLRTHLNELKSAGGYYVRNTMNSRRESEGDVHPFKKTENDQYNLTRWNEEFWNRFELLLSETVKRDIVVQIELWDGHNYQSRADDTEGFTEWDKHPLNPKNNINYTAEGTTLPKKRTKDYRTETHPVLLTIPSENDDEKVLTVQK